MECVSLYDGSGTISDIPSVSNGKRWRPTGSLQIQEWPRDFKGRWGVTAVLKSMTALSTSNSCLHSEQRERKNNALPEEMEGRPWGKLPAGNYSPKEDVWGLLGFFINRTSSLCLLSSFLERAPLGLSVFLCLQLRS